MRLLTPEGDISALENRGDIIALVRQKINNSNSFLMLRWYNYLTINAC